MSSVCLPVKLCIAQMLVSAFASDETFGMLLHMTTAVPCVVDPDQSPGEAMSLFCHR